MVDTESVLSFISPTLPPSSVCSLNFPLFADCLISTSMPDCFPAFSKQHDRRMDSYGVWARHCIPLYTIQPLLDQVFIHKVEGRSVGENCCGALTWRSGVPNPGASSPREKLLEKGGSAFQTVGVTSTRIEEAGLSERAVLSIVCHLTQDKRSFVLASCQLT